MKLLAATLFLLSSTCGISRVLAASAGIRGPGQRNVGTFWQRNLVDIPDVCLEPDKEGQSCGSPELGICQQSVCEGGQCVFDSTQFDQTECLCGVCKECVDGVDGACGGNCQYDFEDSAIRPKPTSLLMSIPCDYLYLDVQVGTCARQNITRGADGYFNITRPEDCPSSWPGIALGPKVIIYEYGLPKYNGISEGCFCRDDGEFDIHTSCAYDIYLGKKYGPQQDMILAGYCQHIGSHFAGCGFLNQPDPYQCTASPTSSPTSNPSIQPSPQPSSQPSSQSSSMPSLRPSSQPSAMPSPTPSSQPSPIPSSRPSRQPSSRPSSMPSLVPSTQPSSYPSSRPSSTSSPSKSPAEEIQTIEKFFCDETGTVDQSYCDEAVYPTWGETGCRNCNGRNKSCQSVLCSFTGGPNPPPSATPGPTSSPTPGTSGPPPDDCNGCNLETRPACSACSGICKWKQNKCNVVV